MAEKKPLCNYSGEVKELQSGDTLPSSGGGVSDGDKGDVVVSSSGAVWTLEDAFKKNHWLNIYTALGSAAVAETINPLSTIGTNSTLTNQRVHFTALWLSKSATITGIKFFVTTAGNYTANNYNGAGLYSYSGGTLTLVASTTNDGNFFKTANWNTKPFSSTYSASPGLYFVAFLYCRSAETTAPSTAISSISGLNLLSMDFSDSARVNPYLDTQTALPSSTAMSSMTGSANLQLRHAIIY